MTALSSTSPKIERTSKGQRTQQRIIDVATQQFALHGYAAAGLRDIAAEVGIQVPGLYKYFPNKLALYEAVLSRAFEPLKKLLDEAEATPSLVLSLPENIVRAFATSPATAALMQQALNARPSVESAEVSAKQQVPEALSSWLSSFFHQGAALMAGVQSSNASGAEKHRLSKEAQSYCYLAVLNAFIMTSGYFCADQLWQRLGQGEALDEANIQRQIQLMTASLAAVMDLANTSPN